MNEEMKTELCQSVQAIAKAYLSSYSNVGSQKAVTIADDATIQKLRSIGFPKEGRPLNVVIDEMIENIYANQAIMQHPRFFAFVPSPASPLSWIGDVMTYSYNPHAGSWLQSSSASCIEQEVTKWFCRQAGYPKTAGGLFVSGGSMSNLTALVAARNTKLSEDEYVDGVAYLSGQTHSCVARGLRIIGLRSEQIKNIPCDDNFRMDVKCLDKEIIKDFYGRAIGTIITKPNGDKVIKDFYGRVKGTYIKKSNYTKDFYGRVVGKGDLLASLLYK